MRICIVTNIYGKYARGGAERVVANEARALAAAGHDVTVICGVPKGEAMPESSAPRVIGYDPGNIFFYTDDHKHSWPVRLLWHVIDMWNDASAHELFALLDGIRPDVVHTHNLMGLGFVVPAAIRELGVRHVHTVHDVQLIHPSGLLPTYWTPRYAPLHVRAYVRVMRQKMGSPDVVIFPSEYMRQLHVRLGFFPKSDTRVVRNPYTGACATDVAARKDRRFLFAGQLEKHKGILALLEAWQSLQEKNGAILEIAGAGTMEREVRRRAQAMGDVVVLGKLGAEDMRAAFMHASFVVFPSLVIENAPMAIVEAFANGVPVIAARTGGVPELVTPTNGMLYEAGTLADALLRALRLSADEIAALSRAASESCMKFSLPEHVRALESAYRG